MADLKPTLAGGLQLFKAYQEFTAPDIDYDILQLSADQRDLEAENVMLQVEQEANLLREEFIEAMGAATYGAARRGVKVGEGDIQQNIEESAGAVGKDIQTVRKSARFKAGQLRGAGERYRAGAETQKEIGALERIGKGVTALGGAYEAFEQFGSQKDDKKEDETGYKKKTKTIKKRRRKKKLAAAETKTSVSTMPIKSYSVANERTVKPNILAI